MFSYVKLKNFMSLHDVMFDFTSNKKNAKQFVAIYGENGSGKSNFVNSIGLLRRSIDSFSMSESLSAIQDAMNDPDISQEFKKKFLSRFAVGLFNFSSILEECRMVGCEDETRAEYGFIVNGHHGIYEIAFTDTISYERLYYYTGKQSGQLFEVKIDNNKIKIAMSAKLCLQNAVRDELEETIQKYWGKHSVLSILAKERAEKNESYIRENYLSYAFDLVDMLKDSMIHQKKTSNSGWEFRSKKPYNNLKSLDKGTVKKDKEYLIDCAENILQDFFTQTYADIKRVFYSKDEEKDEVRYQLYVEKMIGGQHRVIPFQQESAGTQQVLEILRSLFGAFSGVTVIYDEIDDGIHDLLLRNILTSMQDDITGQIIITTHNTLLMEEINVKSVYVIDADYRGEKCVSCLSEFPRIQGSNNPRRMYLKGMFGGVPIPDIVDYTEIITELDQINDRENTQNETT